MAKKARKGTSTRGADVVLCLEADAGLSSNDSSGFGGWSRYW